MRLSRIELLCLLGTAVLLLWALSELTTAGEDRSETAAIAEVVPSTKAPREIFPLNSSTVPSQVPEAEPQGDDLPPTMYPATAAEQQAKDALAKPGDWVTPPAYSKSE